jgi:hypothetical protein
MDAKLFRDAEHNSDAKQRQCGGCPARRGASEPLASPSRVFSNGRQILRYPEHNSDAEQI